MKRKVIYLIVFTLLVIGTTIYLSIGFNYQISFRSSQSTLTLYEYARDWQMWRPARDSAVVNLRLTPASNTPSLLQRIELSPDSVYEYEWAFERVSDSLTHVRVRIGDVKHFWYQKWSVMFGMNEFVERHLSIVKKLKKEFEVNQSGYRTSAVSIDTVPSYRYMYLSASSTVEGKAKAMMKETSHAMNFINKNDLRMNSSPFLYIKSWDREKDSIHFDFCFPIAKDTTLVHPEFKIGFLEKQTALSLTFNGNYSISNIGWYTLIDYANQHEVDVEYTPIEFFKNDPHSFGDPMSWEARVYLPLLSAESAE